MKDLFSTQAGTYAKYRPVYPPALYDFLFSLVKEKNTAWDCGTGNGQVARVLAGHFKAVTATDISEAQLQQAPQPGNVHYIKTPAEKLSEVADHTFDLITVATALHWFDFDAFYQETKRVGKDGCIIAAWCYSLLNVTPELDEKLNWFCFEKMGPYWDKERKWVDEAYTTIPFPFEEIQAPAFAIQDHWSLEHLEGYLNSWSALQHYIKANGTNPVHDFIQEIQPLWKGLMPVTFPLPLKVGRITS
jgi:cyclopropane fatty-acyl-phospholipid synthase-like methyltransferase